MPKRAARGMTLNASAAVLLSGRVMLWGWLRRQSSVLQPFDSERIY